MNEREYERRCELEAEGCDFEETEMRPKKKLRKNDTIGKIKNNFPTGVYKPQRLDTMILIT